MLSCSLRACDMPHQSQVFAGRTPGYWEQCSRTIYIYIYLIVLEENIALTAAVAFTIEIAFLFFLFSGGGGIPGV